MIAKDPSLSMVAELPLTWVFVDHSTLPATVDRTKFPVCLMVALNSPSGEGSDDPGCSVTPWVKVDDAPARSGCVPTMANVVAPPTSTTTASSATGRAMRDNPGPRRL